MLGRSNGPSKRRRPNAHSLHALPSAGVQNGVLQETDEKSLGEGRSRILFSAIVDDRRFEHCVRLGLPRCVVFGNSGVCGQERFGALVGVWSYNGQFWEIDRQSAFDGSREEYESCAADSGMALCF